MKLLVLSIGSNLLPNYIVAKYLLMNDRDDEKYLPKPDKIMMVFSNDTEKFHKSIVKLLKIGKDKRIDVCIEDGQRSFDRVYNAVKGPLNNLKNENISLFHYNYTGGTKPMVLAITQAVKELFPEHNSKNLILSYFTPENYKIVIRDGNGFPAFTTINKAISIRIKDLYQLHCLKNVKSKDVNSKFYNLERAKFLFNKRNISNKESKNDYFFGHWDNIDANFKNDPKACKSELKESIKETPFSEYISDIEQLTSKKSLNKIKDLIKFIRGDFLEEYIFYILLSMKKELGLTEIAWNVEAFAKNRQFEIDIIAMKGCQAFVISCTTDSKIHLCKSKAFEVFYRAEMVGGAKAQSILVCLGDNSGSENSHIKNISADMQQFDAAENFHLISKDDLIKGSETEAIILNDEGLKSKLRAIIGG